MSALEEMDRELLEYFKRECARLKAENDDLRTELNRLRYAMASALDVATEALAQLDTAASERRSTHP